MPFIFFFLNTPREFIVYIVYCFVVGGSSEAKYAHIFYEPGFVKILPGNFLNFDISGNDGRVYVSIVTRNKIVADNFPVRNDYSVIVDDQGSLRPTKYGTIWVDKQGNHHNNSDEDDDDHDDYDGHE